MPLIKDEQREFKRFIPQSEPEAQEAGPSTMDIVQSAFTLENTFVNFAANGFSLGDDFAPAENYNPFDRDIKGFERYADSFIDSRSPEQTQAIKNRISEENRHREVLANGGVTGFVSTIAAGITDPVYWPLMFVGVGEAKAAQSASQAFGRTAAFGAAAELPAELAKQQLQETRTIGESAMNIGGSALLSGLMGAGINKLTRDIPEAGVSAEKLTRDIEREVNTGDGDLSMGAMQTRVLSKEELELSGLGGLEQVPVSPLIRTATSPQVETRRIASQMLETPLVSKGNIEGKATAPEGGAIETRVKRWDANLYEGLLSVKDNFKSYKKTNKGKSLSQRDFRIEVGKAMRRGDKHEIPEVAQAAKDMRTKLFDSLKDAAIEGRMLPQDVDVNTAASYLTRVYNFDKINAKRPEWSEAVDGWLKSIRGGAQEKLAVREAAPERIDLTKQDFGDIKIKETVKIKELDATTKVEVTAKDLWNRTTRRRRLAERLRNCLNA